MTSRKTYRLPNDTVTMNYMEYNRAWSQVAERAERAFPGYTVEHMNPTIKLVLWGTGEDGKSEEIVDRVELSMKALEAIERGFANYLWESSG